MTKTRMMAGAIVPLTAMLLAGCGSKPAAQADGNGATKPGVTATAAVRFDPCSVLTPAEVSAITTDTVAKAETIDHECHYRTGFDDDGTEISIYPTDGADQMKTIREAYKMLGGIGGAVSTQGDVGKDVQAAITPPAEGGAPAIGDEALWGPNDALAVRKGDAFVQVTPPIVYDPASHRGSLIPDAEKRMIAQKLVEAVLAKLH